MRKLFLILTTLMLCTWGINAQTRTIKGTVIDATDGEPLTGATVMPIGGGQGVAADLDGNFTLNVPNNVTKAKVSYVGYTTQTVDLKNGMVVKLQSSSTNLDEMVVVAYGTATKESLTGAVAVVGSKEIEERPVTSVTSALEGSAPGVQVNNSTGQPGSAPSIRIRGFNSFNSSAQSPLYVVDGIPFNGSPSDLNPADVESMTVLKDAASCALYGNRGANGVILITTKKAKNSGNVDVTASVRVGAYNRGLPFYDKLDAYQWMETYLSAAANARVSSQGGTYQDALNALRNNFVNSTLAGVNIFDLPADELFNEQGKIMGKILPGYTDLDWWKAISRQGLRTEYSINAAAATDKFNIFSSVAYLKENGYVLDTDFERFTGRINANFQPVSYFRTGLNLNASYTDSEEGEADSGNLGSATNPFNTEFKPPIVSYYAHDAEGNIIYQNGSPVWNTGALMNNSNVAWEMRLNQSRYTTLNVDATLYGTAVLPYGFELTVRGSIFRNKQDGFYYMNNIIGSGAGVGNYYQFSEGVTSHTFMQTLDWSHDYGDHHVDVLLDHENYKYSYDSSAIYKAQQSLDDLYILPNFTENLGDNQAIAGYTSESYLGRVRYNYDQKYFLEASLRRDGSSKFSKKNHWGTFWSVGGSWIISKEKFLQEATWMNYLKLRAAYGSVGNDLSAGYYSYLNLYQFTMEGELQPAQWAAENLKWESTNTLDVALEGSLFNDRFTFSVGYFNKRNSDLIFTLNQPASAGTPGNSGSNIGIVANIGSMDNHGWELQFGYDIINNANLKWNFNVDATFLTNKIKDLPYHRNIVGQALFMGKSIYEKYTYEYAGVDQMNGRSLYAMNPDSPDFYTYDENGNYVYSQETWDQYKQNAIDNDSYIVINGKEYTYNTDYAGRKLMGTALPTVYGSFGSNLTWKSLSVGFLFTYSLGGKTMNSNYNSLMSVGDGSSTSLSALHKDILKAWTTVPEGMTEDSPNRIDPNGIPQVNFNTSSSSNTESSRFLVSNDYLCLKNINISYELPKKWSDAMKLKGINVGFMMDNVFIASKMKGMNPTYGYAGGQGAFYVPARTYTFQLNVKF